MRGSKLDVSKALNVSPSLDQETVCQRALICPGQKWKWPLGPWRVSATVQRSRQEERGNQADLTLGSTQRRQANEKLQAVIDTGTRGSMERSAYPEAENGPLQGAWSPWLVSISPCQQLCQVGNHMLPQEGS